MNCSWAAHGELDERQEKDTSPGLLLGCSWRSLSGLVSTSLVVLGLSWDRALLLEWFRGALRMLLECSRGVLRGALGVLLECSWSALEVVWGDLGGRALLLECSSGALRVI